MKRISLFTGCVLLIGLLCLAGCGGEKTPAETAGETSADTVCTESAIESATADTLPDTLPDTGEVESDLGGETGPVVAESETTPGGETETATGGEEETTAPLPLPDIRMQADALSAGDDGVTLNFSVDMADAPAEKCKIVLVLSDADGEISRESVTALTEAMCVTLACPAERIAGELTLTATAAVDGTVTDSLSLEMKDRLPQLTPDGVRCVVAVMTDEEKAHMVVGTYEVGNRNISGGTYAIARLGVPSTLCMDGTAGVRYNQSVWYPAVINVASSWDTELSTRVGVALGQDTLAHGFDIVLAPGINIQKNVLGGRNFEYASEDPLLSGLMIAPYVNGIESTGAGTSLKHYAANNQETSRGGISSNVTERALREIYLKGFGIVIKDARPMTIMSSYNQINGKQTAADRELLTDILRGEFGFRGYVMSDWGAGGSMAEKIHAGNDLNMPGDAEDAPAVLAGLASGTISEDALNACCYHILSMVAESATYRGLEMNTGVDFRENGIVATEAAADGMVLLQNENAVLPLPGGTKLSVFGNSAVNPFFGGSGSAGVTPKSSVTILEGLARYDGFTVVNQIGNPFAGCAQHDAEDASKDVEVTVEYAAEMAEISDVAVIVIGRNSMEGKDRRNLKGDFLLNDTELSMIDRLSSAFRAKGKKLVVLLNTGSPIEVASWKDRVDAILWIGYPGQGAGTAVARVLSGHVNPSGKTTITWPLTYSSTPALLYFPGSAVEVVYYEDIYVGYRYYETFDVDVSYPFGYGLSYTTFAYSDLQLAENADGTVTATVTVRNTGVVAGREVVQLYVTKPEHLQEQASLELAGFAKTASLAPGESESVTITVRMEALMTYDTAESRWVLDEGTYTYRVGPSVAGPHIKQTVAVEKLVVVQDVENRCEPHKKFDFIQKDNYTVPEDAATRENLLLGKPITSNYDENESLSANFAVDGDYISRWSGLGLSSGSHHVLDIDLGAAYAIGELNIIWESVHAPFTILYSTDGESYTEHDTYLDDGTMRTFLNLYGAEARYIRLQIQRSGQYVSIFEIEAFAATQADIEAGKEQGKEDQKSNLAIGKPVLASGVEGAYVAENAVDGSISTRWGSNPSGEGWIVVDLESLTAISRIRVTLEAAWVPYTVEYSTDGEAYTKLCDKAKDILLVDEKGLDIEARYIRIRRDGANWFSIYEIEVYGK